MASDPITDAARDAALAWLDHQRLSVPHNARSLSKAFATFAAAAVAEERALIVATYEPAGNARPTPATDDALVEAIAEAQLSAFLAGRGSVTSMKHGTRSAKPAPTMDDFRNIARSVQAPILAQLAERDKTIARMREALEGLVNSFEKHRPKALWDAARAALTEPTP